MLAEAMTALAAAGGTAVVQAAGTDAWTGFRQQVASWFGRGNAQRESAELERLDQTAAALEAAEAEQTERVQLRQEASWEAWFIALLESLNDEQQERAAAELRALLAQHAPQGGVSAGQGGIAAGRDVNIKAEQGSIATGVLNGDASIGTPTKPDPSQG
ncbi:hypothetical protein GCM10010103_66040 [Streptomyces paradoxus]|uniref:Uncharacterized protein n=1 Tax=Streptomyces paradoxus TaxID=66375 RepID=A0A7W9TJ21_9ACTN|nr:hypothetical protein [Streptomyces paradoxus]MBB6080986.1 hypothetical protein [Streptomyces paradoxus]